MGYEEWLNRECRICGRLLEKYLCTLEKFFYICEKAGSQRAIALILFLLTMIGVSSFALYVIGPGIASEDLSEEERIDKFTNWAYGIPHQVYAPTLFKVALFMVGILLVPFWTVAAVTFLSKIDK